MMKKAFTLIELLVVIAIIAILAAILFPVFAQAKVAAKKTQALSNYKQMGTSAAIYVADYDDLFPLSASFNGAANCFRTSTSGNCAIASSAVPAGWTNVLARNVNPRLGEEQVFVLNAIQPYVKNYGLYEAPGQKDQATGWTQLSAPAKVNLTMNGFLHAYSTTAVASISKNPLFWQGFFRINRVGAGFSAPLMDCGASPTCHFNPGGYPGANTGSGYGYNWWVPTLDPNSINTSIYGKSSIYVATDTSARTYNWGGLPIWPLYANGNVNTNPFSSNDSSGVADSPYWITDCVSPGAAKPQIYYAGYMRPDSEYNYTVAQCDFGGG